MIAIILDSVGSLTINIDGLIIVQQIYPLRLLNQLIYLSVYMSQKDMYVVSISGESLGPGRNFRCALEPVSELLDIFARNGQGKK